MPITKIAPNFLPSPHTFEVFMEQAAAPSAIREAHPPRRAHSELVYGIEDVPPLPQTLFAALQHMLAMFAVSYTHLTLPTKA